MRVERLKELVVYNPETGHMRSKVSRGNIRIGRLIGSVEQGYLRARIDGKRYFIHRLAWLYMSGYKGVSWNSSTNLWCAFIWHNGKNKNLGSYHSPEEAHLAYANKAQELRGAFARIA